MKSSIRQRNPGPPWGYRLIRLGDRIFPDFVVDALVRIGSVIALIAMPTERRSSREYLTAALRRPATVFDCWSHFTAFTRLLLTRFRVAAGAEARFRLSDEREDHVETLARSREQAFYGTFHCGRSDLMGFWLSRFGHPVSMIRYQVGNSDDLNWLESRFAETVDFIFVNEPSKMLFELKRAVDEGKIVAMKCDRVEHSSKLEVFDFLGERRLFPFTIYHLAILFQIPLVFAVGLPGSEQETIVHSSTIFRPDASGREENLARARTHFQDTLSLLESLLSRNPWQWFNFGGLNPIAEARKPPSPVGTALQRT